MDPGSEDDGPPDFEALRQDCVSARSDSSGASLEPDADEPHDEHAVFEPVDESALCEAQVQHGDVNFTMEPATEDEFDASEDQGFEAKEPLSESEVSEVSGSSMPSASRGRPRVKRKLHVTASSVFLGDGQQPGKLSKYALRGMSKDRIADRLKTGVCKCKKLCADQFEVDDVAKVCERYWKLSNGQQRVLMKYLYSIDEADLGKGETIFTKRSVWSFAGREVCLVAFSKLLGSSKSTVLKRVHGDIDFRTLNTTRYRPQSSDVDQFWLEYWSSNAETLALPDKARQADEEAVLVYDEGVLVVPDEYDFSAVEDWTVGTSDVDLFARVGNDDALRKLPKRFLPHARLQDYYFEYVSWHGARSPNWKDPALDPMSDSDVERIVPGESEESEASSAASWGTFLARWSNLWSDVLRIRKSSQHAECNICFKYRQQLRSHRGSLDEKLEIAMKWRHHLHWQYVDRCTYWSLRWASRTRRDVLTIIIDALDKSKFVLPKYEFGRKSKELDQFQRPAVILTGAIAHGYHRAIYISDEDLHKGGSFFIEVLCQTIEKVYKASQESGESMPNHLIVVVDNTVAQAKNDEGMVFSGWLTAKYHFRSTNMLMLTEGHTHEDIGSNVWKLSGVAEHCAKRVAFVGARRSGQTECFQTLADQMLGLLVTKVLCKHTFETPQDVAELCMQELGPLTHVRDERFYAEVVQGERDWKSWMAPLGAHLSKAFGVRKGLWAPHSFSFKLRQDLLTHERAEVVDEERRGHDTDVFCLVKTYIHDAKLQQAPLLVIPHKFCNRLTGHYPSTLKPRWHMSKQKQENYEKLAPLLRRPITYYPRAADYIDVLLNSADREVSMPRLSWLQRALLPRAPVTVPTGNEVYEHLPQTAWKLEAQLTW